MRRMTSIAGAAAVAALAAGCTVVKPIVCAFTFPIHEMSEDLAVPDDDGDDYAEIPPPLVCIAAPVLIPLRFVAMSVLGFAGGLVSGFASDLNVITWNCEAPWTNLSRPYLTNAREPGPR